MRDLVDELLQAKVKATLFGGDHAPRLGRLVILDRLGSGAMGTVFVAYDARLDRRVAVKVVREATAADHVVVLREARALGKLAHPNVVAVHDVVVDEGEVVYLVMELAPGVPLRAWMSGEHGWREVVAVMRQVGAGVAAAHRAGIVHRDLKPDNVLVGGDRPRVVDFGLAGEVAAGAGTPSYMAPELIDGGEATPASDQFAFGVTLYEALHGRRPFAGVTRDELPASSAAVPAWLQAIVARMLAAEPAARFPSLDAVLAALAAPERAARRHRVMAIAGLMLVAGAALGALGMASHGSAASSCGDDPRVAEAWSPAIGLRVRAATAPWGERTGAALDAAATRWTASHRAVCEATRVRGEQSDRLLELRMRCLDRAHERFVALVHALDVPATSPQLRAGAIGAVLALPDPAACEAMTDASDLALPADPAGRARAVAAEHQLDRAWAAYQVGRYAEARVQLPGDAALPADAAALRAQVLALDAAIESRVGKPASAREHLERALVAAAGADARALEVDVWANLLRQELFGGAPAKVLDWEPFARAAAARAGQDGAELDAIVGEALRDAGRLDDARERLRRALRSTALRDDRRALVQMNLGSIALAAGDLDAAERELVAAFATAHAMLGDGHPELAIYLDKLAAVDRARGRIGAALARDQQSLQVRTAAFGDDDRAVATSLYHRAETLIEAGRLRDARADLDRARRSRVTAFGEHSARLGELDAAIGDAAVAGGDKLAAVAAYTLAASEDPRLELAARRYAAGDTLAALDNAGPRELTVDSAAAAAARVDQVVRNGDAAAALVLALRLRDRWRAAPAPVDARLSCAVGEALIATHEHGDGPLEAALAALADEPSLTRLRVLRDLGRDTSRLHAAMPELPQ